MPARSFGFRLILQSIQRRSASNHVLAAILPGCPEPFAFQSDSPDRTMRTDRIEQLQEQVLVLQAQMGDRAALSRLIELHHGRLAYFVRRLLPEAAEDVVQETWLTAHQKLRMLADPSAFTAWVYGIARRKAWQHLQRRGVALAAEEVLHAIPDPHDDPAFATEDAERLHEALGRLRLEHREVLTLRFVEDMSYEQIAAVVGCSLGTVRSRLHYAKQALQREMEDSCDEEQR
jgi:RNA polymerase sigma-70 factor (ECF subfamily)